MWTFKKQHQLLRGCFLHRLFKMKTLWKVVLNCEGWSMQAAARSLFNSYREEHVVLLLSKISFNLDYCNSRRLSVCRTAAAAGEGGDIRFSSALHAPSLHNEWLMQIDLVSFLSRRALSWLRRPPAFVGLSRGTLQCWPIERHPDPMTEQRGPWKAEGWVDCCVPRGPSTYNQTERERERVIRSSDSWSHVTFSPTKCRCCLSHDRKAF